MRVDDKMLLVSKLERNSEVIIDKDVSGCSSLNIKVSHYPTLTSVLCQMDLEVGVAHKNIRANKHHVTAMFTKMMRDKSVEFPSTRIDCEKLS